jgi:hypothetical protein
MESWLDRASQVDHLRRVEIAEIVIEAIQFREKHSGICSSTSLCPATCTCSLRSLMSRV